MTHYYLHFSKPSQHIVQIKVEFHAPAGMVELRLPHWRPGRYELQNYARLVADVSLRNQHEGEIPIEKVKTHSWQAELPSEGHYQLSYQFFAKQSDAGGTYFDADFLLFNGITCLMYLADQEEEPCHLQLELPRGFQLSQNLPASGQGYLFESFHQLVDSPFLAGRGLQHQTLKVGDLPIHLWCLGQHSLDLEQLVSDVKQYSQAQLDLWGPCPVEAYHYLYFFLPHRYRHGVEHHQSTVIVMGPGMSIHEKAQYKSLLEISSHEFFHTWNVKALRPADMFPYQYESENYSRLHYITEGVTTYYGDLMLWKAGIWNLDQWLESINGELARHYQTGANPYTSLAEASFDSWVNGYRVDGFPNRRISFYTKGYLVALLLDTEIRRMTEHRFSLDTVMQQLYHEITMAKRGYTESDYRRIIAAQCGHDLDKFFQSFVHGKADLRPALAELADHYGLHVFDMQPTNPSLGFWGLRTQKGESGKLTVEQCFPGSPAESAGIPLGAELIALDGHRIQGDLDSLLGQLEPGEAHELHYFYFNQLKSVQINPANYRYTTPQLMAGLRNEDITTQRMAQWHAIPSPQPYLSS